MRTLIFGAAVLLAACSPPSQESGEATPAPAPELAACNAVAPNLARQVSVQEPIAAAAAAADLRGGAIAPGTYDLASATRFGAATGWSGTRAVALAVSESADGAVTFDWAAAGGAGATDRWTATFSDTPALRLTYTCGRMGAVAPDFAVEGNLLRLRIPDGANGSLELVFERRA